MGRGYVALIPLCVVVGLALLEIVGLACWFYYRCVFPQVKLRTLFCLEFCLELLSSGSRM